MKTPTTAIALATALFVTGSPGAFAADAAVDCDTAQADIAHLQHEKKSTEERAVNGVLSIMPIGIVLNTATSVAESGSKKEMDIQEYNQRIDQRIQEIKSSCGLE